MENTTSKQRRPRCREWERQRRIKFNDAISKLGEIVKAINKANSNSIGENAEDNVQYPKIEIVQKAIICLTNCAQEKTRLKGEILALEVKLETIEKQKLNKRDVSLQVTLGVNKRNQNKYLKLLMLQKDKQNNCKEKIIKASSKSKIEKKLQATTTFKNQLKLPKLLPLSNVKKDNTIVMLPATPYIFPQRSLLFPPAPPTIVLLDANVQGLSKPTPIPIINRCTNDITKTTMVNVLPISAYSRPLSASKSKKKDAKPKSNGNKKNSKKADLEEKKCEEITQSNSVNEAARNKNEIMSKNVNDSEKGNAQNNNICEKKVENDKKQKESNLENMNKVGEKNNEVIVKGDNCKYTRDEMTPISSSASVKLSTNVDTQEKCANAVATTIESEKDINLSVQNSPMLNTLNATKKSTVTESTPDVIANIIENKCDKISSGKTTICDERNKEKLTILDPTICESVVDGGNARLELAEELLAASPTAAFLMSFPLVSGNRADSPAEEQATQSTGSNNNKESSQQNEHPTRAQFFDKTNSQLSKLKANIKPETSNSNTKINEVTNKPPMPKAITTSTPNVCNENPFLNLPIPTIVSNCTLPDTTTFGLDFDCNLSKTTTTQPTSNFSNSNNIFYKSDPLSTVKSTIYSTSTITSGHEYNTLGLYPCAVDNYTNKNKTDYHNTEDNIMKINSSRLTYDIDLGWSHKSFDFVNCTTTNNTFHKDNILTTATPYSTSYNPFNPDFHVPLVPNSNKKNTTSSKLTTFPETITNFYSQNSTLWSEDIPNIYSHSNVSKNFTMKQQNYLPVDHIQPTLNSKTSTRPIQHYDQKQIPENTSENVLKTPNNANHQISEKFTKKSPSKMHINWMTSDVRPMQTDCSQPHNEIKDSFKLPYSQHDHPPKKQTQADTNYFPINMHHFPSQSNQEEHVWPAPRPAGTTEVTIEPPPINLPTLVGDLALGPHDRKKNDILNRGLTHSDLQNCNNFSVTQLMNRSSDNVTTRSNGPNIEPIKSSNIQKQNSNLTISDSSRKGISTRLENHAQLCYVFNDPKANNTFENMAQFPHSKSKPNKTDKNSKIQKNSYSAESLIRGGTCSQKHQDNKFVTGTQKYNEYNIGHESSVAQVSHFPPIIDYSDNNFAGQQFSGTTLYNSTTNSISNSFYTNFMPSSSNLMSSNYAGGPFTSEFVDYNQTTDCNYGNHKYDPKIRSNPLIYQQDKEPASYKTTRRESAAKHKLECSKKETISKKYQSKRTKINNDGEDWHDTSNLIWQAKSVPKRHANGISDDPTFPNYMGNQMAAQYQPEYFNSHLVTSNAQNIAPNADRSISNFPVASRSNFNLSALFPEITTKVQ